MKISFIKIIVAVVLIYGSINIVGCGSLYNVYENIAATEAIPEIVGENKESIGGSTEPEDEYVTGAWKDGMFWCGDYRINLECPEAGHPSGSADSEWSTGCKLDDGTSVIVDFFSREGFLEDRIAELENLGVSVEEDVLWENPCHFYHNDEENATIVFIKVDEHNYVEITFGTWEETDILFEDIPDVFKFTITDKF